MLKSEKKVVNFVALKRLAELFPSMTIKETIEYIEYCEMIKREMDLSVIGVTDGDDAKC